MGSIASTKDIPFLLIYAIIAAGLTTAVCVTLGRRLLRGSFAVSLSRLSDLRAALPWARSFRLAHRRMTAPRWQPSRFGHCQRSRSRSAS
jgi:hypothetical protein